MVSTLLKVVVGPADSAHGHRRDRMLGTGRAAIALMAGIMAAAAATRPTGIERWDDLLTGIAAFAFVYAVSRGPRALLIVSSMVACALGSGQLWTNVALTGLLLASVTLVAHDRYRLIRAMSAGCAVQGLLRMAPVGFFGLPSLIVGALILAALTSAIWSLEPASRRVVVRSVIAAVAVCGIAVGVGVISVLSARADVDRAASAARAGLAAARDGDLDRVERELAVARDAFVRAGDRLDSPLVAPLRLFPVGSQNLRAADVALGSADSLIGVADDVAGGDGFAALSVGGGGVDLDAIATLEAELAVVGSTLASVSTSLHGLERDWIVSHVGSPLDELVAEVDQVLVDVRSAEAAASMMPSLLGQSGARRYFVALGTPAQSRELGGMMGSYLVINVDDGNVEIVEAGRVRDLYPVARASEFAEEDFPRWYLQTGQPSQWPQNITGSPDVAVVAEGIRQILDGAGGGSVDGVIYLDTWALIDLLKIVGPIDVSWSEQPLSATTAPEFFFDTQYRFDSVGFDEFEEFDAQRTDAFDEFAEVLDVLAAQALDRGLPSPDRLGSVLGPAIRAGRVQIVTFDSVENSYLRSIGLQREFGWPSSTGSVDAVAVVQANAAPNKMDLYLHRHVRYQAQVDSDGGLEATVSVEFESIVPDDAPAYALGREDVGESYVLLSLYSPHELTSVVVGDEEVRAAVSVEGGYWRYLVPVWIARNATEVVVFDMVGEVDPSRDYALDIWSQPLVNNDTVEVVYRSSNGQKTAEQFELSGNVTFLAPPE